MEATSPHARGKGSASKNVRCSQTDYKQVQAHLPPCRLDNGRIRPGFEAQGGESFRIIDVKILRPKGEFGGRSTPVDDISKSVDSGHAPRELLMLVVLAFANGGHATIDTDDLPGDPRAGVA